MWLVIIGYFLLTSDLQVSFVHSSIPIFICSSSVHGELIFPEPILVITDINKISVVLGIG